MIIDCDSHFFPRDAFDYVPTELAPLAPQMRLDDEGHLTGIFFPGQVTVPGTTPTLAGGVTSGARLDGNTDIDARVRDLERMGVDLQIVLPQFAGWWSYLLEPKLGSALAHSYNVAMLANIEQHPDRFRGVALVAAQDIEGALAELEWAKAQGFVAVVLDQTFPELGHPYGTATATHREVWPIYEWCESNDFPVMYHFVSHGHKFVNHARFLHDGLDFFTLSEPRMNIVATITSGLLDRYPNLKVIQAETGTRYLPSLSDDLDRYFFGQGGGVDYEADEATPAALRAAKRVLTAAERAAPGMSLKGLDQIAPEEQMRPKMKNPPSEYLRRNFLWTIETEEDGFSAAVSSLGADRFLFATDYPHDDPGGRMKFRDVERMVEIDDIPDADKDAIRVNNAMRVFDLTS